MGSAPVGAEPGVATLVVTVSSTYGAGGSVVGPELARRLGLPFVPSAIVPSAFEAIEEGEGLAPDEPSDSLFHRLLAATALATTGAVIRRRGAAAFLGDDPRSFHVRLDGPHDRRIRQAMVIEGIGEDEAKRRQAGTDDARSLYLRRFYERDAGDPTLYHLMLDSTVVPLPVCTDVIATAARATRAGGYV